MIKNIEQARLLLEDFGESLDINEIVYAKVTLFVLRYVYNDKKSKTLAESRCLAWKRMKEKVTQKLPPGEDTMRGHIFRCYNVIFMNLQHGCPNAVEAPYKHGWISQNGVCVPRRYQIPALPPSMIVSPTSLEGDDNKLDKKDDRAVADDIIRESDSDDYNKTNKDLSADDCEE